MNDFQLAALQCGVILYSAGHSCVAVWGATRRGCGTPGEHCETSDNCHEAHAILNEQSSTDAACTVHWCCCDVVLVDAVCLCSTHKFAGMRSVAV